MQNTTEEKTCFPLMKLPPELRNLIYRSSLVKKSSIKINPKFNTPNLLTTNRQIRAEAIEIYHLENFFLIEAYNCDSTLFEAYVRNVILPLGEHISSRWLPGPQFEPIRSGSWTDLMHWCWLVWDSALPWPRLRESDDLCILGFEKAEAVVLAAMNVAVDGRELPWEAVERQLRGLRPMAMHLDDAWKP